MSNTADYMVRATAADGQIRAFAVTGRELVQTARKAHGTTPTATAALGRTMCGALMMADMLKGDKDLITIQISGDGPLGGLTVTADNSGRVKGYVNNPLVLLPPKADGHLDVGGAVGKGVLTVIRDLDLKNTYSGQVELMSGEIAEDIAKYFAVSEQVPSAVGLGVLVGTDTNVLAAGGYIIQLMPFASDAVIDRLEKNITSSAYVTDLLSAGHTPETMLKLLLDGLDPQINDSMPVQFYCNCDKERVERALILLGRDEIRSMATDQEDTVLTCQFCKSAYHFSRQDLLDLISRIEA
ncbi:MAG: Hsp33 family molecular chaperone HslO [Lachnospiraceae bacterium]|nr:Hsp33 family molecular chaperone HslO [Lachnospiraceae bacterium]